jgi:hypothetical protein
MSVSLDGFYAGPAHTGDANWMESAEAAGFFRVTRWATDATAWRDTDLDLEEKEGIELVQSRVVPALDVTHIRYEVTGRAPLLLDDRGSSGGPRQPFPNPGGPERHFRYTLCNESAVRFRCGSSLSH